MKKFLRNNGLSIILLGTFVILQIGLSMVGLHRYNKNQAAHDEPGVEYTAYVMSSDFIETTMENWESEFLQMFAYIVLTVFLFQKGSAESKDPDEEEAVNADPRTVPYADDLPGPVKKGGLILKLYENSLGLAFLLAFLGCFILHGVAGASAYNETQLEHGGEIVTVWEYFATAQFWFESLQNWQSEFLSIGLMVVLTVYLRQRGSPESKLVACPHHKRS